MQGQNKTGEREEKEKSSYFAMLHLSRMGEKVAKKAGTANERRK